MSDDDVGGDSHFEHLILESVSQQITRARLQIPYETESLCSVDLGLTEHILDEVIRLLFSTQEVLLRTVKVKTDLASMSISVITDVPLDGVWPVWLMLKERLKAMTQHAPVLLLLDSTQGETLSALHCINVQYHRDDCRGGCGLLGGFAMSGDEYAVNTSNILWKTLHRPPAAENSYTLELIVKPANEREIKPLPIDFPLPERVLISGEAIYAVLHTLAELEMFWQAHRAEFPYAAQGVLYGEQQTYLDEYQWVFAKSKTALVRTVTRWDQVGIQCEWYDWATDAPLDFADFFKANEHDRAQKMAQGVWSDADEANYQAERVRRNPESYRGWWVLSNLPWDCPFHDWLSMEAGELSDPLLSIGAATILLQEQTFDDWVDNHDGDVWFFDVKGVDEDIAYWRAEKAAGRDYYGMENESGGIN
jgi:hypothetical protein